MNRRFRVSGPTMLVPFLALLIFLTLSLSLPGRSFASLREASGLKSKSSDAPADSLNERQGPHVADAVVCRGVEEREPIEPGDRFPADVGSLSCFCRIVHGKGTKVVHAWIHEGQTRARVELEVGSDSWRTWSTKRILPSWTGGWEVKVMTPDGIVLDSVSFTIY